MESSFFDKVKSDDLVVVANALTEETVELLKRHDLVTVNLNVRLGDRKCLVELSSHLRTYKKILSDQPDVTNKNYQKSLKAHETSKKNIEALTKQMLAKAPTVSYRGRSFTYYDNSANIQKNSTYGYRNSWHQQNPYYYVEAAGGYRKLYPTSPPRPLEHPDRSRNGSWVKKENYYSLGSAYIPGNGYCDLLTNDPKVGGIVAAACLKLLVSLEPDKYKELEDIRDHYMTSCLFGVADISFKDTAEGLIPEEDADGDEGTEAE